MRGRRYTAETAPRRPCHEGRRTQDSAAKLRRADDRRRLLDAKEESAKKY